MPRIIKDIVKGEIDRFFVRTRISSKARVFLADLALFIDYYVVTALADSFGHATMCFSKMLCKQEMQWPRIPSATLHQDIC